MQHKGTYLDLVVEEAEELAARIAQAKNRFAKQKVSVKIEHVQELERVRSRCTEFKRCVEELEEAQELHVEYDYAAAETAWNKSMDAVDTLLRGLP